MLKIDLAKAFDKLEWHFIDAALARKGFIIILENLSMLASPPLFFLLS